MPSTFAPFGLRPARKRGSAPDNEGLGEYQINSGYANDLHKGTPVALNAVGAVVAVTGLSSLGEQNAIGVFMGCRYNDPNTRSPVFSSYWPAATSTYGGTRATALVADDPSQTFWVQADASVTTGDIGYNFLVSASSSVLGNNFTGSSAYFLDVASRTTVASAAGCLVRVINVNGPGNVVQNAVSTSDAYPIVEVQWVQHKSVILSTGT